MGITKRVNLDSLIVFIFFAIYPFGQILRLWILQPLDVIVAIGGLVAFVKGYEPPPVFAFFRNFLFVIIFSWIFSLSIFPQKEVFYGLLYLFRIAAYFYFFIFVYEYVKNATENYLVSNLLLLISTISAVFGWIQFFLVPDMKPFFTWGWDIHLFRLVGTFLDPAFLGLIIVFGLIISISKKKWFLVAFLLLSLAFTYSRASYLAFFVAAILFAIFEKKVKVVLIGLVGFFLIILILPTARNHSIELSRSFSVIARIADYKTTFKIFSESPIFGVGYNNLCLAYQKFIGPQAFSSHACSGSDSSLLFVLAATGVVGFISFLALIYEVIKSAASKKNARVFIVSLVALGVHSLFSNSFFYPWILGYILVLFAVTLRRKVES